jgi:hypothetical protein
MVLSGEMFDLLGGRLVLLPVAVLAHDLSAGGPEVLDVATLFLGEFVGLGEFMGLGDAEAQADAAGLEVSTIAGLGASASLVGFATGFDLGAAAMLAQEIVCRGEVSRRSGINSNGCGGNVDVKRWVNCRR